MLAIEKVITNAHEAAHTHQEDHNKNSEIITNMESLVTPEKKEDGNILTPAILLFALGIHAIFEGIAAGLAVTRAECIQLLLAIGIHKWVEAMALVYF